MYTYIPVLQQRAWGISPRRRHLRSSCLLRGPWHREWQACCPCSHSGRGTGGGQEKGRGMSSEIHTQRRMAEEEMYTGQLIMIYCMYILYSFYLPCLERYRRE